MAFRMTGDIVCGPYKPFKCKSANWNINIDNYSDTARFVIPAICRIKSDQQPYSNKVLQTGLQFSEGMPVEIYAGYDGKNDLQFKGFIKRINFKVPLEVECEGYSYQLRKKVFNKSYKNASIKQILSDLIEGTDITLSRFIPDVIVPKITFKNYYGTQVLDWFKEKMLQTVYFNFNELYVGLRSIEPKGQVKHRLNWNVERDDELLFNNEKEGAKVNITLQVIGIDGVKHYTRTIRPVNEKRMRVQGISETDAYLKKLRDDIQTKNNYIGYTGRITTFLKPYCRPGMSTHIYSTRYENRNGIYFIEAVQGVFDETGGRQTLSIGYKLG